MTAIVLGNRKLGSLIANSTSTPQRTAFPFMTNEPKNQFESNWVPLCGAIHVAAGTFPTSVLTQLETTLRTLLEEQPSITTLEDSLASHGSLAYSRNGGIGTQVATRRWHQLGRLSMRQLPESVRCLRHICKATESRYLSDH